MDIHGLECFYRAYESGSIAKTADDMFVMRQAVSQTLQNLESEIGQKLFVRSNRGLQSTAFARDLYPLVMKLIEDYRDVCQYCSTQGNKTSTVKLSLSLGVLESISVPSLMETIHQKCPNLLIDVTTAEPVASLQYICDGTNDMALIIDRLENKMVNCILLAKAPICALVHESLLPPNPIHTIHDLDGLTWFGLSPHFKLDHDLVEIFERENIHVSMNYEYGDYHIILEQAFNKKGVCAIPEEHASRYEGNNMVAISFSEYGLGWDICLLFPHNGFSGKFLLVIEAIKEFFANDN